MRIIEFRGGLGNQMFEYAHYLYLKEKYPEERFYGYYPGRELWVHNGLEIHRRFNVDLPSASRLTNIIGWLLFTVNRKLLMPKGWHVSCMATDEHPNDNALFQEGYWQDKKYFSKDFRFTYKTDLINEASKGILKRIKSSEAVAVHVRRGDYLTCDHPEEFSGICTSAYYQRAIEYIGNYVDRPMFFFFSDDSEFVRQSFHLPGMCVVDCNHDEDSFLDMYLMSQCKAMILANSTFSFWAAQNNLNHPIVCCPTRWANVKVLPNITMDGWIEIPS